MRKLDTKVSSSEMSSIGRKFNSYSFKKWPNKHFELTILFVYNSDFTIFNTFTGEPVQ